jgi:probable F420-dependent oxidoreductase
MRFGFVLPNNWGVDDVRAVVDLAHVAEEVGFDAVWVNHHVLNAGYIAERLGRRPYHDPLTVLTAAAMVTERVELGTSVLVLPYLHPVVLAKQLATVDQLSGGRVVAGVGVGTLEEEHRIVDMVPFADRGAYADESLDVMRLLWTAVPVDHDGVYFSFREALASPAPVRDPLPIIVGGNSPPALRRAARHGQGWQPIALHPASIASRLDRLDEALHAAGRVRNDDFRISIRRDLGGLDAGLAAEYEAVGVTDIAVHTATDDIVAIRGAMTAFADRMIG